MEEISVEIKEKRINSSSITIEPDLKGKFEVRVACKAQMRQAKEEDEKSVLLVVKLNVDTKDKKMQIKLDSEFIFNMEEIPDDYDELAEKTLIPMAKKSLLDSLDQMLLVMGFNKMNLGKNYDKANETIE